MENFFTSGKGERVLSEEKTQSLILNIPLKTETDIRPEASGPLLWNQILKHSIIWINTLQNNTHLICLLTTGVRRNFMSNSTQFGCIPMIPELTSPTITVNVHNDGAHTISCSKMLEVLVLPPQVEDIANPGSEMSDQRLSLLSPSPTACLSCRVHVTELQDALSWKGLIRIIQSSSCSKQSKTSYPQTSNTIISVINH